MSSPIRTSLVYGLAWWSGFFVMSIELLAGRILSPYFGNSIYVWGGIITVFMSALSLGYLFGGRLSLYGPRLPRLGLIVGLAALTTVPIVLVSDPILDWLFHHLHDPRYGSLAGAILLFLIPTAVSGAVSPYAIRLLVENLQESGKSAGFLYFVSTFGSAAGTIVTSFYLVLYFAVNHIVEGLIGISIALGLLAGLFERGKT